MVDYTKVPVDYMRESVRLYVEDGIQPGSFLTAVICNDFAMAVVKADRQNGAALREWALFFLNEVPPTVWGSHDAMSAWLQFKNERN
jgi:hypothetical protein